MSRRPRSHFGRTWIDWSTGAWYRPAPARVGGVYTCRGGWTDRERVLRALDYVGSSPAEVEIILAYLGLEVTS